MSGSKAGPERCIPPTRAWIRSTPVSRWAWRSTLIAPAWLHPDSTTSPRPATCTTIAWSSWIQGSGSQEPPRRASPPGRPRSNGGDALDLAGDEHGAVDQQARAALLADRDALALQVAAARGRQAQLAPAGEDHPPFAPGVRVQHERQPRAPRAAHHALEAAVMVGVAVREDHRAQVAEPDAQDVHVVERGAAPQAGVVEQRRPLAAALDLDQQREPVLGAQVGAVGLKRLGLERRPRAPRRRAAAAC